MLIDLEVLKSFGTTNDSFRDLFTAETGSPLADKRKLWEDRLESRIHEGTLFGLKNYQFYAASDLAWDSNLVTKELVPLQLYAQGKITFSALKPYLKDLDPETQSKFCQTNEAKEIVGVDIPAFHKVVVNLGRSFITRRTAALAMRYTKLQPFYRYEPRSTSFVAKLRGDVLSQRIEGVVDAFGYRHDLVQNVRAMLMYSFSLEFAATAWEQDKQLRKKKVAAGLDTSGDKKFESEAYIAREGVIYTRPHPTRTFWDQAYPLSSINTDTGCTYMGYWSMPRYRDVSKNPIYFNRDKISFDAEFLSSIAGYRGFWELYSAGNPVNLTGTTNLDVDVPGQNDREKNVGLYTSEKGDQSMLLTEYREKVIPKEVGLGDYPFPIWVRLVVASDRTVIFGEILPSTPATYWGYNCDDNKLLNNAWMHDILPFQDLLSNGLSNLLLTQRAALIKMIMLDIDLVNDPEVLKSIRSIVKGDAIYNKPHLIEFKGSQTEEMGMKPRDALQVAETLPINDITMHYRGLFQLLGLAEKILGFSQAESAASEPREVSATESANIAGTTNTTVAYQGLGIDEGTDAKKKQLYESFMAMGDSRIQVPAANRYMPATIAAAGFKRLDESEDGNSTSMYIEKGTTILGSKENLIYEYNFSSRDGSERASNAKAAEVLVQLLTQLVQFPGFGEAIGKERLFSFLNEVVLLSGAGVDLRFDLKDGEATTMPETDATTQGKDAIEQALHQIMDRFAADEKKMAQLYQMMQQLAGGAAPMAPPAAPAPGPAPIAA